jgi:hypothetical protein
MQISPLMSRRIEEEIAALAPQPIGHINFDGLRYHALPLFGTLGEVWLLRPDGSIWRADSETDLPIEPLPVSLHTIAIVAGTRRYEWLADLLPKRPAGAVDCTECRGLGRIGPRGALFCHTCGALGWRFARGNESGE